MTLDKHKTCQKLLFPLVFSFSIRLLLFLPVKNPLLFKYGTDNEMIEYSFAKQLLHNNIPFQFLNMRKMPHLKGQNYPLAKRMYSLTMSTHNYACYALLYLDFCCR